MCISLIWQGKKMANNLFSPWEASESREPLRCCIVPSRGSVIKVQFGWREQIKVASSHIFVFMNLSLAKDQTSFAPGFHFPQACKEKNPFNPSMHNCQHGPYQVVIALLSPNMRAERAYAINRKISMPCHSLWIWAFLTTNEVVSHLSQWLSPTEPQQSNASLVPEHRPPTQNTIALTVTLENFLYIVKLLNTV